MHPSNGGIKVRGHPQLYNAGNAESPPYSTLVYTTRVYWIVPFTCVREFMSLQDHLMVVYLFNLVKTQLVLGEKLCQITS